MTERTNKKINHFESILKEVLKIEVNSYTDRINFSILQSHETIEKYVDPLINGVATYSKIIDEIEDKNGRKFPYHKYAEQNILKYCQDILEIVGEKAASCKAALEEGLYIKAQDKYRYIFNILFTGLTELMYKFIRYYEENDEVNYSLNITDKAMKEIDDFELSKSYDNIINNIDYIKDTLLQMFES